MMLLNCPVESATVGKFILWLQIDLFQPAELNFLYLGSDLMWFSIVIYEET